jgi:allophanate hydrolase
MTPSQSIDLGSVRALYKSGTSRPTELIESIYSRIQSGPLKPVWISLAPRRTSLARARELENDPMGAVLPLYGVPYAIKDNFDLEGAETTVGCPAFGYSTERSATVVQLLNEAGAVPVGKTNLDQFATGLVGTRSPYGACSSIYDARYISGGSSAGSAVAVAAGLVSFALGSDTAGSGCVAAAFNNLVGLKPTRGALSTIGLFPACRSLDCATVLARTCHDAHTVWLAARRFDPDDPYSRCARPGEAAAPWVSGRFRFGVPSMAQLEFFGDEAAADLYEQAIGNLRSLGGEVVEIDFAPFREAAEVLNSGPWVAERLAALGRFFDEHSKEMNPVVREIIGGGRRYSAVDAYKAEYRLRELRRQTEAQWAAMDVLALPTAGTIYTHEQVAADPIGTNDNLGYYTNFVNLLDLAAVAAPAGFRPNGLPFGISLIGPAFSEEGLLAVADRFHRSHSETPGPAIDIGLCPPDCVALAVVGAHLSDQPLNRQLTEMGARLLRACRTAPGYRLYALDRAMPPKPALVRDEAFSGPGIEVEVWAVPTGHFGGFVAAVPAPLTIGNAVLDSGETVNCFLAEPYAVSQATEITRHGGWRGYLAQSHQRDTSSR